MPALLTDQELQPSARAAVTMSSTHDGGGGGGGGGFFGCCSSGVSCPSFEFAVYEGVYAGGWRAGKRHGQGRQTWATGAVYEGGWEAGKHHGRGKYVNANGSVHHDGEWRDGNVGRGDDALQPEHEVRRRRFKIFL